MAEKTFENAVKVLAAMFAVLGTGACSLPLVSQAVEATTFHCVTTAQGWGTIARRGRKKSQVPVINWNTVEFGPQYTPKKRCEIVSKRLTDVVAANGGGLGSLVLTTGKVSNGYHVVCYLTPGQSQCDLKNMLFTLKKDNAKNPSEVLTRLTNFTQGKGTDSTVDETGGNPEIVPLETLVERSGLKESVW
ncbi:MAG: hypothetical protein F6J93_19575 [Oscillatoria sp. SIO1A7]|nr:hypothetical protein [Oscillatoria sp. SIO1A7]